MKREREKKVEYMLYTFTCMLAFYNLISPPSFLMFLPSISSVFLFSFLLSSLSPPRVYIEVSFQLLPLTCPPTLCSTSSPVAMATSPISPWTGGGVTSTGRTTSWEPWAWLNSTGIISKSLLVDY